VIEEAAESSCVPTAYLKFITHFMSSVTIAFNTSDFCIQGFDAFRLIGHDKPPLNLFSKYGISNKCGLEKSMGTASAAVCLLSDRINRIDMIKNSNDILLIA
jgi:hypothetical protein